MSRPKVVRDDLMIEEDAKVNVDYLAHSWTYEEMWATRKHVRQINQHSLVRCRFENALWRAWLASTRQTIRMPAAFISWDKDSDITWLYGPLKSSRSPSPTPSETPLTQAPRKPSLKRKPSIWEIPENPSTTSNDSTDGKSLLGRFWNITIHSVPSIILSSRQNWNKRQKCRVRFEEEVQQCQYTRDGGNTLSQYSYNYNYPFFLEEAGLYESHHVQQTIEPLPSTYLTGYEAFQPVDSGHYYPLSNFLDELEYVSIFVHWPAAPPRVS
ncbi:hypothetical protein AbraIFM66951_003255 [Aspergillus brasiliensis]|uniref:Nitrogen regulatory protein areA GATA-like domain-containing protein n=1 Tax=Aspergillus brasiliensis TaxID=319629 RepID=A0A9W6DPQ6_9EURO|nr:hypothetical protein AbraCBS73388_011189 [Aspergillus brasiliensis]GKZ50260.1 hypothetical protein AbraIFM66951_003255 [Aspergillus brasiliensis]